MPYILISLRGGILINVALLQSIGTSGVGIRSQCYRSFTKTKPIAKESSLFSGNAGLLLELSLNSKITPLSSVTNQRMFIEQLAKKLKITDKSEFHRMTSKVLRQHGGKELLQIYKTPAKLFSSLYSEYHS